MLRFACGVLLLVFCVAWTDAPTILQEKSVKAHKSPFLESTNYARGDLEETQTQEDTQMWDGTAARKRDDRGEQSERPRKKTRISLASAVDLAE